VLASRAVAASPLPEALLPLAARPAAAAVLLDLDGTLAPIVARPEDARPLPGVPEALEALRDSYGLVGFVSGRALADLVARVGVDGLAYAGNHGMELRGPDGAPRLAEEAAAHLPAIRALAANFPPERLDPHGLRLEDKGATLSFHYRTAPDRAAARAALAELVVPAARAAGLAPTEGRMVLEVRPPVRLDKGTAVRALLEGRGLRAACFVGDDRTDADAWRALRELRAEGALDVAVAVVARSAELDPAVRAEADVEVDGPAGARDLLLALGAAAAPRDTE
jgi:trehalose 6-phosphate phosphatase